MLIFNADTKGIYNLDNIIKIWAEETSGHFYVQCLDLSGLVHVVMECESMDIAEKILDKIYHRMTLSNGNCVLTMAEFKKGIEEEKKSTLVNVADIPCVSDLDKNGRG